MFKPLCKYYVSMTNENGTFDINCSRNGKYKDCEKESFAQSKDRQIKLLLHCNKKMEYCKVYKKFKEEEANENKA